MRCRVVTIPRTATVVVDARHGFAHAAFEVGRAPLVDAAKACGVGILSISHSYSAGVLGWFVERLAGDGLVSVMFANSSAAMAPAGGAVPFFGTNPVAWAAPRKNGAAGRGRPLVVGGGLGEGERGRAGGRGHPTRVGARRSRHIRRRTPRLGWLVPWLRQRVTRDRRSPCWSTSWAAV